jgi:acyl-coenzyme A thioesterase PaaI-like protein
MTTTHDLAGPAALGIELGDDLTVVEDGWVVREVLAPSGLDGPEGILQGGFSAGLALAGARGIDRFGAPITSIDARLHAPTPLGRTLQLRARATEQAATYAVETRDGDRLLVSAEVELAGHDPAPRALDLVELATVTEPEADPQPAFPRCFVCGTDPTHPHAQRLLPRWHAPGAVVVPWVCDDDLGPEGTVDPLVVSAVLDCPTVWSAWHVVRDRGDAGALLASYHLRFFRDAPVMEPLRTVARLDEADGRKLRARGALVDEDGGLYAVSSALHISVPEVPQVPPPEAG